jgi:hypothetical protein
MAARSDSRSGMYLVVTIVALVVAVYLTLQILAFVLKLALLVLAVIVGLAAWRAWTASRQSGGRA